MYNADLVSFFTIVFLGSCILSTDPALHCRDAWGSLSNGRGLYSLWWDDLKCLALAPSAGAFDQRQDLFICHAG